MASADATDVSSSPFRDIPQLTMLDGTPAVSHLPMGVRSTPFVRDSRSVRAWSQAAIVGKTTERSGTCRQNSMSELHHKRIIIAEAAGSIIISVRCVNPASAQRQTTAA
jgi:hypothetical protein